MDNLTQPSQLKLDASNLAVEWSNWSEEWDLYFVGSGLEEKPAATQRAVFLHCIGPDARAKFKGFMLSDDERKDLTKIKKAFEDYCTPASNEVIERYQFWHLSPGATESIDAFVSTLRSKAKACNFGDQEAKLIRDRIVFTCPDKRTKEALIRADKLDLDGAIRICRAAETARDSMRELGASSSSSTSAVSVAAVTTSSSAHGHSHDSRQRDRRPPLSQRGACGNCGGNHEPRQCPAFGKECSKCRKKNHYARCCRGNRRHSNSRHRRSTGQPSVDAHAVDAGSVDDNDVLHIGELLTINTVSSFCSVYRDLNINGTVMPCKIDTGAQVNAISLASYNNIVNKPALRSTSVMVKPYGMKQALKPVGRASLKLGYKDRQLDAEFIVLNTSDPILLGLETCRGLGIVHIDAVDAVTSDSGKLIEEFADVFKGLGCVPGEYDIKIDPSVPPVIQPTRKVPLNLRPKLRQVLDEMERRGVIVKRTDPTEWVNALLLVEKKNGTLRVCMDPVPLNKAIKREHYSIPTFDDVVAEMHGKKMFTLIDMRDGFWHVKLSEASSRLCTFSTPFGRYSYERLSMGLSCSPEVFQRKNIEMFGDIPNVHIIYDESTTSS